MPVYCYLRLLLVKLNAQRAALGQRPISLRRLAAESGVSLSVLVALHTGRSGRIDYATLDRLLSYFNRHFEVGLNDLLSWEAPAESEASVQQVAPAS